MPATRPFMGPVHGVLLLLFASFLGCTRHSTQEVEFSGPTMGTAYAVKLARLPQGVRKQDLQTGIEGILAKITREMSVYEPDSEISAFNASPANVWVPVSTDFATVVEEGLRISRESGGAFDLTVAPLIRLWGFGTQPAPDRVPAPGEIETAKKLVGGQHLRVRRRPPALRKDRAGVIIDVNGIAPGFAADKVAAFLDAKGARDYLVDMGGELRLRGKNARKEPWAVAIRMPDSESRSAERVLHLTNTGISTSGDYSNFFELDGRRYSHEIDPRTGRPIPGELVSVTVLAPTAMAADAWSTALIVLGQQQGLALATRLRIPALFIVRTAQGFQEKPTAELRAYLKVE